MFKGDLVTFKEALIN